MGTTASHGRISLPPEKWTFSRTVPVPTSRNEMGDEPDGASVPENGRQHEKQDGDDAHYCRPDPVPDHRVEDGVGDREQARQEASRDEDVALVVSVVLTGRVRDESAEKSVHGSPERGCLPRRDPA